MSLRAIKKQQQLQSSTRQNLFKKYNTQIKQQKHQDLISQRNSKVLTKNSGAKTTLQRLENQAKLLGRLIHSNPELKRQLTATETIERLTLRTVNLRTKSENDISTLIQCSGDSKNGNALTAKSEVSLQTISTHNYQEKPNQSKHATMISGARSHRDLTQSTYGARSANVTVIQPIRRMSESSLNSGYSHQTNTLTTSSYGETRTSNMAASTPLIGIRGYEVIEERARFTVYKLRVENPITNDCWLVLRRYTDFVRLNNKIKQAFPHITLMLPRKKIFGDNFNAVFLDNRVQGLQIFVNSVMARDELRRCKIVREFFCLDEPPSYSESMEECRAIFEAQEETIAHLKLQISHKNELILNLQQKLREEILEKEKFKEIIDSLSTKSGATTNITVEDNN